MSSSKLNPHTHKNLLFVSFFYKRNIEETFYQENMFWTIATCHWKHLPSAVWQHGGHSCVNSLKKWICNMCCSFPSSPLIKSCLSGPEVINYFGILATVLFSFQVHPVDGNTHAVLDNLWRVTVTRWHIPNSSGPRGTDGARLACLCLLGWDNGFIILVYLLLYLKILL